MADLNSCQKALKVSLVCAEPKVSVPVSVNNRHTQRIVCRFISLLVIKSCFSLILISASTMRAGQFALPQCSSHESCGTTLSVSVDLLHYKTPMQNPGK